MGKAKIAITLESGSISELDRMVKEKLFQNRSQAIQEAVSEKLMRLKKTRLANESAKLEKQFERQLSEEGMVEDSEKWPPY